MKTSFDKYMDIARMQGVTKVEFLGDDAKGWSFAITWENRPYPNFVSSRVKTNNGAVRNFGRYIKTGKFSLYGNAE